MKNLLLFTILTAISVSTVSANEQPTITDCKGYQNSNFIENFDFKISPFPTKGQKSVIVTTFVPVKNFQLDTAHIVINLSLIKIMEIEIPFSLKPKKGQQEQTIEDLALEKAIAGKYSIKFEGKNPNGKKLICYDLRFEL